MPDPRCVTFGGEMFFGYKGGGATAFDAYGRKPWQEDYDRNNVDEVEWNAFHAFQGEFARRFGRKRRGWTNEFNRVIKEDSEEAHRRDVQSEGYYKAKMRGKAPSK